MNYQKHYNKLIERAANRTLDNYFEKHHILPKCLGGNNKSENLVKLTAEEHFVAHQLLVKIYPEQTKLAYAAKLMCIDKYGYRVKNKHYGWLKRKEAKATSKLFKGVIRPERSKEWCEKISNSKKGQSKPHTKESKAKISESNKNRIVSEETKIKMSKTHSNMSEERKSNIGKASSNSRQSEIKLKTGMYSKESIAKRSLSIKASWEKRKLVESSI
jgi:hypothetical protein